MREEGATYWAPAVSICGGTSDARYKGEDRVARWIAEVPYLHSYNTINEQLFAAVLSQFNGGDDQEYSASLSPSQRPCLCPAGL